MKYLGNMHQGKKIAQTKKVSKAVLKKNEQNINDLMNQVGENEDDSSSENPDNNKISNKKNQPNIDYEMMEDYQPAYSKQKKETEIKDNSLDNNIESLDQSIDIESENKNKPKKQNKIIREKKVVEDDTNNTSGRNLRNRSGIKRMIKQQDESNTNDNRNNILSKSYQKANNPRVIKDITMADNTDNKEKYTTMSFNKNKYKLPIEKDNKDSIIKIFWYDAIEEMFNNKPNVIFFGKIFEPTSNSYLSISIIIKDIYRTLFILPKPEYENNMQKVYEEFEELRKKRFNNIKEYQCKSIKKKYCFELPIDSEKEHDVLKV